MSSPEYPPNIQTQDPVNRFGVRARRSSWPKVLGVLIAAVASMSLLWAVVSVALNSKPGDAVGGVNAIPLMFIPKDDGLAEVKKWLKENLNNPQYEIVRFWPKRSMKEVWDGHTDYLKAMIRDWEIQMRFAPNEKHPPGPYDESLVKHLASKPDVMCRIKFRTKNIFGAMILRDELFIFKDGKAELIVVDADNLSRKRWAEECRDHFPE